MPKNSMIGDLCSCRVGLQCCDAPTDGANAETGGGGWRWRCCMEHCSVTREHSALMAVLSGTFLFTLQSRCKLPHYTLSSCDICQILNPEIDSNATVWR